jgi:hypothetical protein
MKWIRNCVATTALGVMLCIIPLQARADFWGGDLPLLAQILAQAIQEVAQLQMILGNGKDSLNFLRDINSGLRDAMRIMNTMNRTLKSGNLSDLNNVNEVLREIENIYGRIPKTSEAEMQRTQDLSVAESIQLHNDAFRYADETDPEAERLKDYAQVASPQGAAKAGLQAQGLQIHVLNQILRTNAALLKIQSESLALQNKKAKLQSEQFRLQYSELSRSLVNFTPGFDLSSLSGEH